MKNFIYRNQIVHHKPCFNLFVLQNNLFDKLRKRKSTKYQEIKEKLPKI